MPNSAKLAMWVIIFAAIGSGGLWIVGGKQSTYSAAIQIQAPPDVVFEYLIEPEKQKKWVSGLADVGQFESNTNENGSSKRIKTQRQTSIDGKHVQYEDQVIRFEPDKLLTVQSSNGTEILTTIFELESSDQTTSVSCRVSRLNRGITRFLAPLGGDNTQDQLDKDIRELKRLVESNH